MDIKPHKTKNQIDLLVFRNITMVEYTLLHLQRSFFLKTQWNGLGSEQELSHYISFYYVIKQGRNFVNGLVNHNGWWESLVKEDVNVFSSGYVWYTLNWFHLRLLSLPFIYGLKNNMNSDGSNPNKYSGYNVLLILCTWALLSWIISSCFI